MGAKKIANLNFKKLWIHQTLKLPALGTICTLSIGVGLIIASKICAKKQVYKSAFKDFKLVFSQIENFLENAIFLSNYNRFCLNFTKWRSHYSIIK